MTELHAPSLLSSLELYDITAEGHIGGTPVTFHIEKGSNEKYCLGRVLGRKPSTSPQNAINNVYVDSLDDAAEMLMRESLGRPVFYVWLVGRHCGERRRNQYKPESLTFHYRKKAQHVHR